MNPPQHASVSSPLIKVDADRPWLGLSSFSEETQRFFFGRDAEIAEIFVRVRDNTLTTLYGQSGLGKSSLLGAGLLPKLRIEDYRPVQIRLRYDESDPPLLDQVFAEIEKAGLLGRARPVSLWEWLHHRENRPTGFESRPPVLVFDQFEEIFTLGQRAERMDQGRTLFKQLAELIENRSPAELRARFHQDRRLARNYDNLPSPARIVITLREDFLSHLEGWKKILPSLMKNRMALGLLNGSQALQAVVRPGRMEGRNLVDEEVGAAIVRFVARKEACVPLEEIGAVPPLLSLVCDELNRLRIDQNLPTITAGLVETQSSDILNNFYFESFADLPDVVRHFIEDRLITEGGHRSPVAREDAITAFRRAGIADPAAALDQLVARRLINPEERGGLIWIEITHDVLAPLVVRSRDDRLERERAAEAERREMEARKARNKLGILLVIFSILTLLAITGAIYGFLSSREARLQRDEARYNEGLGWMLRAQVAEDRENQYPDSLLYAAQAIGFEKVGRPRGAPEALIRFIREDRNPEAFHGARGWIADHPAYLPVWSSPSCSSESTGLDVSSDGRYLALATSDGAVRLWDLREQTSREIRKPGAMAGNLAFDPAGGSLAYISEGAIFLQNIEKGTSSSVPAESKVVAFSPGGDIMATSSKDGGIRLWKDGEIRGIETGMKQAATDIIFSADNSRAAAVFASGIRVFFPRYSALAFTWEADRNGSTAAAFSPDGDRIAAGTAKGQVLILDAARAELLGSCSDVQRHAGPVLDLAFRPDGRQLASASVDGTVRLWDVKGDVPTVVATLRGHRGPANKLAWFAGGGLLATAGADGGVRIWDVRGVPLPSPDLHYYLAKDWYQFDSATRNAVWAGGNGAANVPADSILGLQRAKAEVVPALVAARAWDGLPAGLPPPPALVSAAESAAQAGNWSEVQLRLNQIDRLIPRSGLLESLRVQLESLEVTGKPKRNQEGMEMIWVKPGDFLMGSTQEELKRFKLKKSDETQHKVVLTRGFWLAKTELTQAQWQSVMGKNEPTYASSGLKAPIENISWNQAMEYCRRLTDLERARGTIPPDWEYNLPTEAQWEYACRAGSVDAYSFGDDPSDLCKFANYSNKSGGFANADMDHEDGHQYTAPVGIYPPNAWGFHDMHGNVWEWCRDSMDPENPDYVHEDATDPLASAGDHRVYRGGGFRHTAANCRSAVRRGNAPDNRRSAVGFRPALVHIGGPH